MSSFLSKLDLAVRYHESINEQHMAYYLRNQLDVLRNITEQKKDYLVASYYVPGELLELLDLPPRGAYLISLFFGQQQKDFLPVHAPIRRYLIY
mgnify:CR=1 FL=1